MWRHKACRSFTFAIENPSNFTVKTYGHVPPRRHNDTQSRDWIGLLHLYREVTDIKPWKINFWKEIKHRNTLYLIKGLLGTDWPTLSTKRRNTCSYYATCLTCSANPSLIYFVQSDTLWNGGLYFCLVQKRKAATWHGRPKARSRTFVETRSQFHQCSPSSFYSRISRKRKKNCLNSQSFLQFCDLRA